MLRRSLLTIVALFTVLGCESREGERASMADSGDVMTPAAALPEAAPAGSSKTDDAMSAAPAAIAQNAMIMDWPATDSGKMTELRAGTNGWVCYPTAPKTVGAAGKDPMCLDKAFQGWVEALMAKKKPPVNSTGVAYMLQGDAGVSNTDPYAKSQTADNQWVQTGPHVMVLLPSAAALDAFPTDPKTGGPFVMWKGTPYAHLMVPVNAASK